MAVHPAYARHLRFAALVAVLTLPGLGSAADATPAAAGDRGRAFGDARHAAAPQPIPGTVMCAYYDVGGEGVAYHDSDPVNNGSGKLNPANGTYLNEFRKDEGVDTSYTKFQNDIDRNPYNRHQPPEGLLYVGWTEPGEWFNVTVRTSEAGEYTADFLYTAAVDATIAVEVNGQPGATAIAVPHTSDPAEPIKWRNWHHWNLLPGACTLKLPQGVSVLTVRILTGGNLNLATFAFRPVKAVAGK